MVTVEINMVVLMMAMLMIIGAAFPRPSNSEMGGKSQVGWKKAILSEMGGKKPSRPGGPRPRAELLFPSHLGPSWEEKKQSWEEKSHSAGVGRKKAILRVRSAESG